MRNVELGTLLGGLGTAAFILAALGTFLLRRLAPRWGLVDHPGERKIHRHSTPLGGGIAIFLGVWIPVGAGVALALLTGDQAAWLPSWLTPLLPGVKRRLVHLAWIFAGSLLLAVVSLIDDRRGLPTWVRLLAVAAVGSGLFICKEERITLFFESPWITGLITVGWIVGVACAFKVLDNMDGLCGGVAFIVALMFLVVALQTGQLFLAAVYAALMGSIGGFLLFNFPPASIFMGECGSVFLGFMLAVLSVDFTFYDVTSHPYHALFPVIVPLLILAVPIFDIAAVIWIRLREGRSPFEADTRHFSHRLVALGMSPRAAVLTIYLVTAAIGMGATVLYQARSMPAVVMPLVQAAAVFAIIVVLERAGLSKEQRRT